MNKILLKQIAAQIPGDFMRNMAVLKQFADLIKVEVLDNGNTVHVPGFGKFYRFRDPRGHVTTPVGQGQAKYKVKFKPFSGAIKKDLT